MKKIVHEREKGGGALNRSTFLYANNPKRGEAPLKWTILCPNDEFFASKRMKASFKCNSTNIALEIITAEYNDFLIET